MANNKDIFAPPSDEELDMFAPPSKKELDMFAPPTDGELVEEEPSYELEEEPSQTEALLRGGVQGLTFDFADASCLVLNPQAEFLKDVNNNSLVFKMTYGEKTFLFTGDMEKKAEKKLLALPYDLKSDFIKIGHHGVDDASSKKFLAAVDPEFAVISSKKNHSYEKILNRLLDKGTKVYITLDGYHIKFTCKDNKIIVSSYESFTY